MSVYNGAEYLQPALDSLLDQTLEDFELIVVDDASTDETPSILDEYERRDDRICVMRNNTNLNAAGARNRGLEACTAPLVAIADADDIYQKERLQNQVSFMRENPEIGVLSGNVYRVDQDGENPRRTSYPMRHEAIRLKMNYTFPFCHPATMFHRDLLLEVGGYNEEAVTAEDVELCSRLVHNTRFANLADPLVKYRRHEESISENPPELGKRTSLRARRDLLTDYLGEDLSLDEADALHALLRRRSTEHSRAEVERGLSVAKKLRTELRHRGLTDLRRGFESELFEAICSQSIKHSPSSRSFGWYLLREAVRISPRQMGQLQGLKKIAAMIRG
jgi:glycosyltransferase involved in cell wall biosynthesis